MKNIVTAHRRWRGIEATRPNKHLFVSVEVLLAETRPNKHLFVSVEALCSGRGTFGENVVRPHMLLLPFQPPFYESKRKYAAYYWKNKN